MKFLLQKTLLLDICGAALKLHRNINQSEDPLWANNLEVGRGLLQ